MLYPSLFHLQITSGTGVVTKYFRVPYRCKVKDLVAFCQADPGDGDTITAKTGATPVGVSTFGSGLTAPAATGAYVPDATNGGKIFEKGDPITLEISACDVAVELYVTLTLDPFCA